MQPRWLGARSRTRQRDLASPACGCATDRIPNRGGENSGGWESQESTDGRFQPGQVNGIVAERTPGGSKASKRACRPLTGEPSVCGMGTVRAARLRAEATGLAIARNRRPGSWVPGPLSGGLEGKELARESGKAIVKLLQALRRRQSNANSQGRNGPRERVRLLGKGKLWRDAPGTRAAWKKAAKRRGPRRTAGSKRPRSEPRASRNRREGQEPWGRHRRECGNSRPTRATERKRVAEEGHPT